MLDGRNQYGRCPYCNKKLGKFPIEYAMKHINRCSQRINPYRYSDRSAGRPSNKEKQEFMENREGSQ